MNKKLIRLTESDLHKIVKESVQKILTEADPRSWYAVAQRYDQTNPERAKYARQRGMQQWNSQYGYNRNGGYDENPGYDKGGWYNEKQEMYLDQNGNPMINQSGSEARTNVNGKVKNSGYNNSYDPSNGNSSYREFGSKGSKFDPNDASYDETTNGKNIYRYGSYNPLDNGVKNANGKKVADQMVQGNGKYVKGKGWQ